MAQSERNFHSKTRGGKNANRQLGTNTKKAYRQPSEQLFPNRRPLSNPNVTKYIQTYIRYKQHKISTSKHKAIRSTTEIMTWNDQYYKINGQLKVGYHFFIFSSGLEILYRQPGGTIYGLTKVLLHMENS